MKNTKSTEIFNKNYQRALDAKKRVARAVYGGKILVVKRSHENCSDLLRGKNLNWWVIVDNNTEKPENITKAIKDMNNDFHSIDEILINSGTEDELKEELALMICAPLGMTIKEKDEFLGKITVIGD